MSDAAALTKLGNLEPKLAGALCYLPVMYIHLLASIAFIATEPKDNRAVRFHAFQSLLITGVWLGGTLALTLLVVFVPIVLIILGGVAGDMLGSDGLAGLMMLLALGSQVVFGLGAVLFALAGPFLLMICAGMVVMEMPGRIPVLASLADRFA
jgi:uncharacterized membrane protein